MVTLVVSSEPLDYGYEILGDVQADITMWAEAMEADVAAATNDTDVRTFSFAQFAENSSATIGKEIGMLTSAAMLLLGIILWFNFRSVRETAYVLFLTVIAIAATYGLSGWLQFAGVNMTFNAAMNSIPVLLLAIGVDYGLHVVLRIREELKDEEMRNPQGRTTLRDFDRHARKRAIRQGTVLTSIALMIAITTDIVGFVLQAVHTGLPSGVRDRHRHRFIPHLSPEHFCPSGSHAHSADKETPARPCKQGNRRPREPKHCQTFPAAKIGGAHRGGAVGTHGGRVPATRGCL